MICRIFLAAGDAIAFEAEYYEVIWTRGLSKEQRMFNQLGIEPGE